MPKIYPTPKFLGVHERVGWASRPSFLFHLLTGETPVPLFWPIPAVRVASPKMNGLPSPDPARGMPDTESKLTIRHDPSQQKTNRSGRRSHNNVPTLVGLDAIGKLRKIKVGEDLGPARKVELRLFGELDLNRQMRSLR
jgi:hypothetical protein